MRRRTPAPAAMVLALGLALTACGSDGSDAAPEVKVQGAFIPEPASGSMAAGFFLVHNSGGADTLSSVDSPISGQVTLHSTEDGVMKERSSFAVPAKGELDFERGGNHLMFENLKHRPKQGDKVAVTLHFSKSGAVTVSFPVKAATYHPASHASGASH
ncbi:copper chaperone PCu(A)C [Streptomyces sp. NPDC006552]|uniref:copper chaperone PCu(A)C n=1 Tax=Streptomyces sp. NPDC006552 TaxID=3157179 RepID=UPI0033B4C632